LKRCKDNEDDRADMAAGDLTINPERQKDATFTQPFLDLSE